MEYSDVESPFIHQVVRSFCLSFGFTYTLYKSLIQLPGRHLTPPPERLLSCSDYSASSFIECLSHKSTPGQEPDPSHSHEAAVSRFLTIYHQLRLPTSMQTISIHSPTFYIAKHQYTSYPLNTLQRTIRAMSQNQSQRNQSTMSSRGISSASGRDQSSSKSDEWSEVKDPNERRKIQNKLAQRRFRKRDRCPTYNATDIFAGDKVREQKEEAEREVENQRRAASSYTSPDPYNIDQRRDLSGLPWGGISMRHIVETGRNREEKSQRSSRESSVYAAASHTGGSSR